MAQQKRQHTSTGAQLTQLERCQGGGYRIAWSAGSREEWHIVLDRVRRLPMDQRRYLDEEQAWWIDSAVLMQVASWFGNFAQVLNSHPDRLRVLPDIGPSLPQEIAQAFAALHLTPSASPELIKASQRLLAKQFHPDLGGNHMMMIEINQAADRALSWAKARQPRR